MWSESTRYSFSGGIEYPHFGQRVLSDAFTLSRLSFCLLGIGAANYTWVRRSRLSTYTWGALLHRRLVPANCSQSARIAGAPKDPAPVVRRVILEDDLTYSLFVRSKGENAGEEGQVVECWLLWKAKESHMLRLKFRVVLFGLLLLSRCFAQDPPAASTSDSTQPPSVPERVRVSEILISTPQPYDRAQVIEAHQRAEEVRAAFDC
jgi:hypothetical protein